eukprot:Hpha_TRINITY_DN12740_c0_g1::TRINITY_DN12740_c0_g1_i2::g.114431::m.114431
MPTVYGVVRLKRRWTQAALNNVLFPPAAPAAGGIFHPNATVAPHWWAFRSVTVDGIVSTHDAFAAFLLHIQSVGMLVGNLTGRELPLPFQPGVLKSEQEGGAWFMRDFQAQHKHADILIAEATAALVVDAPSFNDHVRPGVEFLRVALGPSQWDMGLGRIADVTIHAWKRAWLKANGAMTWPSKSDGDYNTYLLEEQRRALIAAGKPYL